MLIKVSNQAVWDQGIRGSISPHISPPWTLDRRFYTCVNLAFLVGEGGICICGHYHIFYHLLVNVSFALDFESRNVEADLTSFALGGCSAISFNAGVGSLPPRISLSPIAWSRIQLCPWLPRGRKDVGYHACADWTVLRLRSSPACIVASSF